MSLLDRRRFLVAAAGLGFVACTPPEAPEEPDVSAGAAGFAEPLGVQLYTLRKALPENPAEVLEQVAEIGYRKVEALQAHFDQIKPLLAEAELEPASLHLISSVVTGAWGDRQKPAQATPEAVAERLHGSGVEYVVMPYLDEDQRGDSLDHYKRLGEKLNAAAQVFHDAGLGFAYHNHAFELEPMEETTPLDALLEASDPELVQLELDVFWVSLAGEDPVARLRKHEGRVPLVHLKDKAADAPQQYQEGAPAEAFKEVGAGSLDFAAILEACRAAGVKHYFVEQDQTPGDPLASLRQSYQYLRSLKV